MKITKNQAYSQLSGISITFFWVFLYYLPFHAFITTWLISAISHELVVKGFKDVVAVLFFMAITLLLFLKEKTLFRRLAIPVNLLIFVYVLLTVYYMNIGSVDTTARYYGLLVNTRFLLFFISAQLLALFAAVKPRQISYQLKKYVIRVGAVLATFGLFQLFMPDHFMRHFGYNDGTVSPIFTLDSQADARRIASSLRGPNPFGIFLVFIITSLVGYVTKLIDLFSEKSTPILAASLLSVIALFYTYSRSAWIGMIVSLALLIFLVQRKKHKLVFIGIGLACVALVLGLVMIFKETAFIQRTVFHTDIKNESKIAKSDEVHLDSLHNALRRIEEKPNGCGLGCSGPATFHSPSSPQNIPENYYLQIAQEVGIVGLILFLTIAILVLKNLFSLRTDAVARILMATFVGISVSGLFLHLWTDDTISYVWWGLAGLLIGSYSHQGSETANAKRLRTSAAKSSRPSS